MEQGTEKGTEKRTEKGTVIVYGIPAYGHIHSNLYFAGSLARDGFKVIYYAMDMFRQEIAAEGCIYRPYPLDGAAIDLSDGSRILKLYRLILKYTQDMLPVLLKEAGEDRPCAVVYDSLALWGRAVGSLMGLPSFSFYSIAAIDRVGQRGFMAYAQGFSAGLLRYAGEFGKAMAIRRQLRQTYGLTGLGILSVLMNQGDRCLMGYSRRFQPGGGGMGEKYLFLGPMAVLRRQTVVNDFTCPEKPLVYISLGTIFNRDQGLLREILRQFGGTEYQVVLIWDMGKEGADWRLPGNFTVRSFVNQGCILKEASLFITAGGMNSIHEALHYGVPCLLCPQQGEQLLNARRFEALGFGRILGRYEGLLREAEKAMRLRDSWDERLRREMLEVNIEEALGMFRELAGRCVPGAGRAVANMVKGGADRWI